AALTAVTDHGDAGTLERLAVYVFLREQLHQFDSSMGGKNTKNPAAAWPVRGLDSSLDGLSGLYARPAPACREEQKDEGKEDVARAGTVHRGRGIDRRGFRTHHRSMTSQGRSACQCDNP